MREGKKITHRYFTKEEWMTLLGDTLIFEDGVEWTLDEFFKCDRDGEEWEDGYAIWERD